MERMLIALVNRDVMTGCEGIPIEVRADRTLSVKEFMWDVGYDIEDKIDLERGYNDEITGFYIDDEGEYCFDEENCEIETKCD